MSEKKKRNIIIGTLCGVLLLMVIGYAAFNTLLNIEGTTSITSNWDIKITGITSKDIVGEASTVEGYPTYEDLTAEFQTNLVSPGDSITYDITVENQGNLDAEVARVKLSDPDNEAITFETTGISEGDILTASSSHILTVKVTYSDEVTKQPENLEANLTVTLDYVEKGKKSEWTPNDVVYAAETLKEKVVTSGDGLYEDTYEPGRYIYRGANPNNYITFNNEEWRIIAIESDNTLKILRNDFIGTIAFDSSGSRTDGYCSMSGSIGCNVWAKTANYDNSDSTLPNAKGVVSKDSTLKTYLNTTYYNDLSPEAKKQIQEHEFYYGPVNIENNDLKAQINSEQKYSATSYIGLLQVSDYIRANSSSSCQTAYSNLSACGTKWIKTKYSSGSFPEFINATGNGVEGKSSITNRTGEICHLYSNGSLGEYGANNAEPVVPVVYLKPTIVLSGNGLANDSYKIS